MKRFLLVAALFFLGAGTASADYLLIKINVNQLNFVPKLEAQPGQMGGGEGGVQPGGFGGGFGGQPGAFRGGFGFGGGEYNPPQPGEGPVGGQPNPNPGARPTPPPPVPEDPNGRWVRAYVEVKNFAFIAKTNSGVIARFDHQWGKNNWMPFQAEKSFPGLRYSMGLPHHTFKKEFDARFSKEKGAKNKSIEGFLALARWSLSRGQVKEFHLVMAEAEKVDAKHPLVVNFARVKGKLQAPFNTEDPAQAELIAKFRSDGYKSYDSAGGHFRLYAQNSNDPNQKTSIARRLAIMEETLETFYYWFALQENAPQPNLPKYRLSSLLTDSREEFATRHMEWGFVPVVGDGFTARRDNLVVMSSKARVQDSIYKDFESELNKRLEDAKGTILQDYRINLTRDELLSGKINENKAAGQAAIFIAAAQTTLVLARTVEEAAERHTVTNATVRQLLFASEMFPRNVQVPDWVVQGFSAFFETPPDAVYPTIGAASFPHLTSFKHFLKNQRFASPGEALSNLVRDYHSQDARYLLKEAQAKENIGNEDAQRAAREALELARCSSWAFIYYLAQNRKLDYLFNYGKELDKLPRDMDLNELALEACFAKAFEVANARDARQIDSAKMDNLAVNWFDAMRAANLEHPVLQAHYEQERSSQDAEAETKSAPGNSGPGGPGKLTPAIPGVETDPMAANPGGINPLPPATGKGVANPKQGGVRPPNQGGVRPPSQGGIRPPNQAPRPPVRIPFRPPPRRFP